MHVACNVCVEVFGVLTAEHILMSPLRSTSFGFCGGNVFLAPEAGVAAAAVCAGSGPYLLTRVWKRLSSLPAIRE